MTNDLVRQMLEQIETDYPHAITLRTMSAKIGRQPAYLGRLFHQQLGSSVRECLTRVRLEHASELIRDGVKIEAVGVSVGYRSKKNFYQRFKRHYGTTPARYRSGSGSEKRSEPEGLSPRGAARDELIVPPAAPEHQCLKNDEGTVSATEPVLGQMASIVRASNRAWRLAVRAQQILLQHFTRLRLGILLTNDADKYVGANRAALSVTGYSMNELSDLSPSDLFVSAPSVDTRCVWQLVLLWPYRSNQSSNAMVRTKAGESVDVHLVTLKNVLWGRREMSAILEKTDAVPVQR
jgi:AraC-like DNA-binding protein